jgi:hypothetical protein
MKFGIAVFFLQKFVGAGFVKIVSVMVVTLRKDTDKFVTFSSSGFGEILCGRSASNALTQSLVCYRSLLSVGCVN